MLDVYLFINEYIYGAVSLLLSIITLVMALNINGKLKAIRKVDLRRNCKALIKKIDGYHEEIISGSELSKYKIHKIANDFDWIQKNYSLPARRFNTFRNLIYKLLDSYDQKVVIELSTVINDIKSIITKEADV